MLEVARSIYEEMVAHAERAYPDECCGVMVGRLLGETNRVERIFEAANVAEVRRRDRFEMDPGGILVADGWARANGMDVVGFYHSHPDHPPVPSATDNERARPGFHDGYSFLILSIQKGKHAGGRSWTLSGDRLADEPLQIVAGR
ncbi:MAG: M67 family metallopeptidase [Planctomycetes bacterium]|nr:M67 family metallopeptidase [Planctomycetota bacterium]